MRILAIYATATTNEKPMNFYTCHSFRRTTATLVVLIGASILMIQFTGGWKSERIGELMRKNHLKSS